MSPANATIHRKKKCDSTYPICGHCSRLNLLCQHEAPRPVPAGPVGEHAVTPPPLALPADTNPNIIKLYATVDLGSNLFDDSCTADMVASRRAMLRYYTSSFAFMLTTNLENNCFLSGRPDNPGYTQDTTLAVFLTIV